MRDLDSRAQAVMRHIDEMADDFMVSLKSMSSEKKKEKMSEIQQQFNKAKEYGDDKVQLAIQTYELVDKHIRRLDSDLARFETEIHDKVLTTTRTQEEQIATKRGRKKTAEKEKKKKAASSEEETVAKATTKRKKKSEYTGGSASSSIRQTKGEESPGLGTEVLDMPVDPNEPTYCLCHQVSYGEMIGCDNPDCPIEWFHFACVGLTTKPKGKWFCPKCSADRKKK